MAKSGPTMTLTDVLRKRFGGILEPMYVGGTSVLMAPISFLQRPGRWLQAINRYGATISGAPNFAYDLCVTQTTPEELEGLDLSAWKTAFCGAEPIRAETLEKFAETFAPYGFRRDSFYPCYGLAEGTLIVSGGEGSSEPIVLWVKRDALKENPGLPVHTHSQPRSAPSPLRMPRVIYRVCAVAGMRSRPPRSRSRVNIQPAPVQKANPPQPR